MELQKIILQENYHHLLCNSKVHYSVHVSQVKTPHTHTPYLFQIYIVVRYPFIYNLVYQVVSSLQGFL